MRARKSSVNKPLVWGASPIAVLVNLVKKVGLVPQPTRLVAIGPAENAVTSNWRSFFKSERRFPAPAKVLSREAIFILNEAAEAPPSQGEEEPREQDEHRAALPDEGQVGGAGD